MTNDIKKAIVSAALTYMAEMQLSQNAVAEKTTINGSYLSTMLSGKLTTSVAGREVPIAPKWYEILAQFVGYSYEKQYWQMVRTPQLVKIIAALEHSMFTRTTATIIAKTGIGKTYGVNRFSKKHPKNTFVVTVNEMHNLNHILSSLLAKMGQPVPGTKAKRLDAIIMHLRNLRLKGHDPIVILDEAENMRLDVLRMIKALYDGIKNHCAIALIGTPQLVTRLDNMAASDVQGVPQFARRFKAGRRVIEDAPNFDLVYKQLGLTDESIMNLLNEMATNYGELNDYLEAALREADRLGKPLNELTFRLCHGLSIPQRLQPKADDSATI